MLLLYIMTQRGVFYVRNSSFWWWKNNSRLCRRVDKKNLDVNAKIYKYTKLEEFKGDCKKGILQKINAIYIDIKIDLLNGIEIAKKIQQENPKIKIIYMTAYSQYSEAIFKTKPTYLLLKPIKKEQIKKSLEKSCKNNNLNVYYRSTKKEKIKQKKKQKE